MKVILEPLAIANNVTQSTSTHINHVALTLGNLYQIYNNADLEGPLCDWVLWSLSKRWKAADQDVFILSVVLHPWIRGCCLLKGISVQYGQLCLHKAVWTWAWFQFPEWAYGFLWWTGEVFWWEHGSCNVESQIWRPGVYWQVWVTWSLLICILHLCRAMLLILLQSGSSWMTKPKALQSSPSISTQ